MMAIPISDDRWEAFSYVPVFDENNKLDTNKFIRNFSNVAGVIPGISIISGIAKIIFGAMELAKNGQSEKESLIAQGYVIRGVIEVSSIFGAILLIIDIYNYTIRYGNQPEPQTSNIETQNPPKPEAPKIEVPQPSLIEIPKETPKIAVPKSSETKTDPIPRPAPSPQNIESKPQDTQIVSVKNSDNTKTQLNLQTSSGRRIFLDYQNDKTFGEVINDFKQKHKLTELKLIFSGQIIYNTQEPKDEEMNILVWCQKYQLKASTVIHVTTKDKDFAKNLPEKEQLKTFSMLFETLDLKSWNPDEYVAVRLDTTSTLRDCSLELIKKLDLNPHTTAIMIWCYGSYVSTPRLLNENIWKLPRTEKWEQQTSKLKFRTATLTREECEQLCQQFEKHHFEYKKSGDPEYDIYMVRTMVWSECSRLINRRPGAGSFDLEDRLKKITAMENDATIRSNITLHMHVVCLHELLKTAWEIYASSITASYDDLIKIIDTELATIHSTTKQRKLTLKSDPNDKIKLKIGEKVCEIDKTDLELKSTNFFLSLKNIDLSKSDTQDIVDLENESEYLFNYLEQGSDLDFKILPLEDLIALSKSAGAFSFNELTLLCQKEIISRIKNNTIKITHELQKDFEQTPFVQKALHIQEGELLWESDNFIQQIKQIKDELKQPTPSKYNDETEITLKLPSREEKISKGKLMQSEFFHSLFTKDWKPDDNEIEVEDEIPGLFFEYLNDSDSYKNWTWEQINEIFPYVDYFGLTELGYFLKSKICDAMLEAKEKNWKNKFCKVWAELCMHISQWTY